MADHKTPLELLTRSETFQTYERAYTDVTGMPVTLRPVETWLLPFRGKRGENPFCALMAEQSHTCAACLQFQEKLTRAAADQPATRTCAYGLCETAAPVKLGTQTIAFLQTGQVMRRKPTEASFQRAVRHALRLGVDISGEPARRAYFATPVAADHKLDSVSNLLAVFADHLAIKMNQLVVQAAGAEPPLVTRAKLFIRNHHREDLSLAMVSDAVNASRFYLCKQFRKATGLGFTEFISRTRVEAARQLLLNPNLRVSEIGYEVGFQSLSHFNRKFKRIMGESPTAHRRRLALRL